MDKKQAMGLLEQWQKSYMDLTELMDAVDVIFGSSPESEFSNTIWQGFDRHTLALAAALGDSFGWLSWYAHENDFGARGFEASPPGGKKRKVKTLAQLLKIIEESK